jgi:ribonucleotide reductase beta subunit family protein with ferritin-like domain
MYQVHLKFDNHWITKDIEFLRDALRVYKSLCRREKTLEEANATYRLTTKGGINLTYMVDYSELFPYQPVHSLYK